MKTKRTLGLRRFKLKILSYGNSYHIERIAKLEKILARKPRTVEIDLVGSGEIPADSALVLRSVLLARPPQTRIVTNARSSLQGGSVLVWLLGDRRTIRDDARVYFRRAEDLAWEEADPNDAWKTVETKYRDSFTPIDLDEVDYARVLQLIDEFLPVKELAGRLIGLPVLRQFGLVESERVDDFLAGAFSNQPESPKLVLNARGTTSVRANAKTPRPRPLGK